MTILDFMRNIGKNHKKFDGEIGIEIETETKKPYDAPLFTYWTSHGDGSLRDFGIEYVLKQPVRFKDQLIPALEEFRDKTEDLKFIKDSVTTSVHVHLNMLNETFVTMGNFLTLYTLFENLLIRKSGPDRLSNLFCLPICDAEDTYKNIVEMFRHIQGKNYKGLMYSEAAVKYAACNISALGNFGSIEIRSFRGETDIEKIQEWVSILYKLLEFARKDMTPKNVMLSWKERQLDLLNDVFQNHAKDLTFKDSRELIEKNVWYAASIAYAVKDWSTLDEVARPPEFKPKQKELDMTSIDMFGRRFQELDPAEQDHVISALRNAFNKKYQLQAKNEPAGMVMLEERIPNRVRMDAPVRRPRDDEDLVVRFDDDIQPFPGVEVLHAPIPARPVRGRPRNAAPRPDPEAMIRAAAERMMGQGNVERDR